MPPIAGHKKLLEESLEWFKLAAEAETDQRKRELEDLRFVDDGDHWVQAEKDLRKGDASRGIPARPCLSIDKLGQPIEQTVNEGRQSRLAIKISPKGNKASQKTAEIRQGLIRHIEVESNAQQARMWAYERAVKCGRGAYRVRKVYANDGDFDQDLVIERILNQHAVYCDPFAQMPDWSDGMRCHIVTDLTEKQFKRKYPKSKLSKADAEELQSIGDSAPGWIKDTKAGKTYRVAEYWYVEVESRMLVAITLANGTEWEGLEDEAPEPATDENTVDSREVESRTVYWCIHSAAEILEGPHEWDGRYIPIIPVIGKESNIDGERRFEGIVRKAIAPSRVYSYEVSALVQGVALTPLSPVVGYTGQFEGHEGKWNTVNIVPWGYMEVNDKTINGQLAPIPQRLNAGVDISGLPIVIEQADRDIKATTGRFDPSLGNLSPKERSGRAILALQKQSEQGSSRYLDNLATCSMVYEGKVLNDLLKHVYDRPGRIVKVLGTDDEPEMVMLNQPFANGPTGEPMPLPPGVQFDPKQHEQYDLSKGEYSVAVSIGKSHTTRREEGAQMMGEMISAFPQIVPLAGDVFFKFQDFPGAPEVAERLHAQGVKAGLIEDKNAQTAQLPPQAKAQLEQMAQQIQLLSKELQARTEQVEQETAKAEAQAAIKQREIASNEQIAAAELESKVRLAQLEAQVQLQIAQMKIDAELEMAKLKAEAQVESAERQAAYTAAQVAAEHGHDSQERAQDRAGADHGAASGA